MCGRWERWRRAAAILRCPARAGDVALVGDFSGSASEAVGGGEPRPDRTPPGRYRVRWYGPDGKPKMKTLIYCAETLGVPSRDLLTCGDASG